jgi:hypothetical protein
MVINITTGDPGAKPDQAVTIVVGGGVPVSVMFDVGQPAGTVVELLLATDSSTPQTLAYCGQFLPQNASLYTATLDASDSRLAEWAAGLSNPSCNAFVRWTQPDAQPVIAPAFSVTIENNPFSDPVTSEGGPTYYTAAQINALLANIQSAFAPFTPLVIGDQAESGPFAGALFTLKFAAHGIVYGAPVTSAPNPPQWLPASQLAPDEVNYALGFNRGIPIGIPQAGPLSGITPQAILDQSNGNFYRLGFDEGVPVGILI